jgi:hypothetical protein
MKRSVLIVFALFFLLPTGQGQAFWELKKLEISAGAGTTQIFGDIGGYSNGKNLMGLKDFTFRQTRFGGNISVRYRFSSKISARINFATGFFHATDSRGSNITRGFESTTFFMEPAFIGEFYIIRNKVENSYLTWPVKEPPIKLILSMLDFYFFAGFGELSFNVKPNEALAPFVTMKNGFVPVIPAGAGIRLNYSPALNFGLELGGRYPFSDHIDGFTSSASKHNDVYYLTNLIVTYKFKTPTRKRPAF